MEKGIIIYHFFNTRQWWHFMQYQFYNIMGMYNFMFIVF